VLNFDAYGSTASGNENIASALLDYYLSKRSDVYAGVLNAAPGGTKYAGYPTNSVLAVGFRHAF
jgi:predicted porin